MGDDVNEASGIDTGEDALAMVKSLLKKIEDKSGDRAPGVPLENNPVSIQDCFLPDNEKTILTIGNKPRFLFPVKEVKGLYLVKALSDAGEMGRMSEISDQLIRLIPSDDGSIREVPLFKEASIPWDNLTGFVKDTFTSEDLAEELISICRSEDPDSALRDLIDRMRVGNELMVRADKVGRLSGSGKILTEGFLRVLRGAYDASMVSRYLTEMDRSRGEEWLSVVNRLPFRSPVRAKINIRSFREGLESSHYGMGTVKKRLSEEAAYLNNGFRSDTSICLVGPPGVGKTTMVQSFAKLIGRPFQAVTLGGSGFDVSYITGFSKSWSGAAPGAIINAIMAAGADDPIIMLDEIDKIGASGVSNRGSISSALLALLDPTQKQTFMDNFLGFHYDISKVTFIATANYLDRIAPELIDRLRIVDVPSYSPKEKIHIGVSYILPRMAANAGMTPEETGITEPMIREIVENHTREAGCRTLAQHVESLIRDLVLERTMQDDPALTVNTDLADVIGPPRSPVAPPAAPGRINGLYASTMGGGTNPIEAVILPVATAPAPDAEQAEDNKKELPGDQTGNMMHVMKESISVARTAVMNAAKDLGIRNPRMIRFSHVHALSASTPKEGPSAGVAVSLALISAALRITPIEGTAVTGEISLMGDVRPVGGIRDKTFGAMAAGLTRIVLPAENRKDFEKIPETDRVGIEAIFVSDLREAVVAVLGPSALRQAEAEPADISA